MTKKDLGFKIFFVGVFVLFFVGMIFLAIFINSKNIPELTEGEPSLNFCQEKCEDYGVLSSNNNSQYNFIRCECLVDMQIDASPYSGARTKTKTEVYYFDSNSLQKISEEEIITRIKD